MFAAGPSHRKTIEAVLAALLFSVSLAAVAGEPPVKSEAPTVSAAADAKEAPVFKPPPGFRTRKRGESTVYCRREAVMGTRFRAEKCYDEAGIRQLKRTELEQMEMLERIRACNSGSCAAG